MKTMRKGRAGTVPARSGKVIGGVVAAALLAAAPLSLPGFAAQAAEQPIPNGQGLKDFYKIRQDKPVWFENGQLREAANDLLRLLTTAQVDGLNPADYDIPEIQDAVKAAWGGNPKAVRKADYLLSQAFADYARDLRDAPNAGMTFVYPGLKPAPPTPLVLLENAARAPSLDDYVRNMGWMSPLYVSLRDVLARGTYADERERDLIRINMARTRVLPAGQGRYVLVNPPEQRLYMYEDGKVVDSMKVVVGQVKPGRNTPMFASYINDAKLNPYWNVPPDLAWDDVGVHVEQYGLGYLKSAGYQVLSDWSDNPSVVDPSTVDWQAVKDGTEQIRVRQLPGPRNVLGSVKFDIPNQFGVYLHDTSQKELLDKKVRLYSGGCIRLEDANRLGQWLFGHPLQATSDDPDITVPLATPVPVYITYLTAVPDGSAVTFLDDVYDRDGERLADLRGGGQATVAIR